MADESVPNRASKTYPVERGGQFFEPLPVLSQKDSDHAVSRLYAEQELKRIQENMAVLRQQAEAVFQRLEIADWVRQAQYSFQPVPGKVYYLYHSTCGMNPGLKLIQLGPDQWSNLTAPDSLTYKASVRMLADRTWEITDIVP